MMVAEVPATNEPPAETLPPPVVNVVNENRIGGGALIVTTCEIVADTAPFASTACAV